MLYYFFAVELDERQISSRRRQIHGSVNGIAAWQGAEFERLRVPVAGGRASADVSMHRL